MFCHKCGSQIANDASFCQKCGAKMVSEDTTMQTPNIPMTTDESKGASISAKPIEPQVHYVPADAPKKKKTKKFPIIIGAVALAIVAIIIIAMNWNGKIDYEATARAYTPYANSQGLPYNCGEVFDKYIPNATWKIRNSGDLVYLDISGTAKGTEKELVITMQVETANDHTSINPVSVKVDGRETSTQKETEMVFFAFFVAYDEKYDDLSNFDELLNEIEFTLQGDVDLPETYTNDTAGISFDYPSGWVVLDSDNEFEVVEMIDSQNNADSIASFKVSSIFDQDPFGVFTGDEASVQAAVNEFGTFLKLEDTLIGDVPAKGLMYRQAGLKGDNIVTNFWYFIGNDIYQITCSYSASKADAYEPILNAIMDSYKITAANTSGESGTTSATYFVELNESYSEGYEPAIMLYQDGRFSFLANMGEGVGFYNGTYSMNGGVYAFNVNETEFSGNKTSFAFAFAMRPIDDTLVFEGADSLGLTMKGAVFSLCDTPPKSIINAINDKGTYEGDDGYADTSTTTTAADFVGTYSYDASVETPDGQYTDFYYLLEIGLDGSALVVTQTWRGNYLFDHARVSPIDVTGNTLVFDASVVGSTEPEIHSLTYLPAKDSPLGKDTIYIDDDETMPFVRE